MSSATVWDGERRIPAMPTRDRRPSRPDIALP
jgi:hypothetical protein